MLHFLIFALTNKSDQLYQTSYFRLVPHEIQWTSASLLPCICPIINQSFCWGLGCGNFKERGVSFHSMSPIVMFNLKLHKRLLLHGINSKKQTLLFKIVQLLGLTDEGIKTGRIPSCGGKKIEQRMSTRGGAAAKSSCELDQLQALNSE